MGKPESFDKTWNEIYQSGHTQLYPWDCVVSFVRRNAQKNSKAEDIRILEVGCGTACNLWFAAREGFCVSGLDGSKIAIETARNRFKREGLDGDFRVGDFTDLPYENGQFDLAIDRAAITCCGREMGKRAINEVRRTLRVGGRFFFNVYADGHSSETTGRPGPDGVVTDIKGGTLTGVGQICFYSETDIKRSFGQGWKLLSMERLELTDRIGDVPNAHCEWRVVTEKTS